MNIAIFSPNQNPYSETFIQAHKNYIKADNLYYIHGGRFKNMHIEKRGLLISPKKQLILKGISKIVSKGFEELLEVEVAKKLKSLSIDAVLIEYGTHAMKLINALKRANIPFIVHFHGYDASVRSVIKKNNNYKELFEAASYVIAVSKIMYARLLGLGCPKEKLVYNVYGANPIFADRHPQFSNKQAVAVGRFVDKKAPYYCLLAFKKVVEKHKDAKLLMAGEGYLMNTCHNLVNYLGLTNNVELLGIVKPEELAQIMQESYCFVQHSVTAESGDQEGTPLAVLESALSGLPVVSTYHAGIQDVIEHEKTGLLCKEHDVDGMADNLIRIFDDVEYAKQLGKKAREIHQREFGLDRHIGILQDLLLKI